MNSSVVNGKTVAVVTFTRSGIIGGSPSDGFYTLVIHSALVHDGSAESLDGTNSGHSGNYLIDPFFRLFGDATGSGTVTNQDVLLFRNAFTNHQYLAFFDFFGTGTLTAVDLAQI